MKAIALCIAVSLLTACATGIGNTDGYSEFFEAAPGMTASAVAARRVAPAPEFPQIERLRELDDSAYARHARQGYVLIGQSSFTSGYRQSESSAIAQGTQVGADLVVLLNPEYDRSVTTHIATTTPTVTTSHTNGSATAYGSNGSTTAIGNATTTTRGTQTAYVPTTIDRYAYGAAYLVKMRFTFGAYFSDLSEAQRQQLQTNRGAYVNLVVDGSPAYDADIVPGDVIVSLNGQPANGYAGFKALLDANQGRTVEIVLLRQGTAVSKSVSLLQ